MIIKMHIKPLPWVRVDEDFMSAPPPAPPPSSFRFCSSELWSPPVPWQKDMSERMSKCVSETIGTGIDAGPVGIKTEVYPWPVPNLW